MKSNAYKQVKASEQNVAMTPDGEERPCRILDGRFRGAVLLAVLAVAVRVLVRCFYDAQYAHDTFGYQSLAVALRYWDFSCYRGLRPPGYSSVLLLCGMRYHLVVLWQQVIGVATVLFLYDIARDLMGGHRVVAFACCALTALYTVFLEFMLLTEPLSTFLVVISFWLFIRLNREDRCRLRFAFLLGLAVALASLTRPNLLCLGVAYGLAVWLPLFWRGATVRHTVLRTIAFLLPVIVLVSSWCVFNKLTVGVFAFSVGSGMNLFDHAAAHLDIISTEHQTIRNVMLDVARRAGDFAPDNYYMIAWRSLPEMQDATGLTFAEVSSRVGKIAVDFYFHHPFLYLKSVLESCVFFWAAPSYCNFVDIPASLQKLMFGVVWGQRLLMLGLNLVFLVMSPVIALRAFVRRVGSSYMCAVVLMLVVMGGCLSQALVKAGENGRFGTPFQPLVIIAAVYFLLLFPRRRSCL